MEKFEKVASSILAFIVMFAFILGSRLYFITLMIYHSIFTCSFNLQKKQRNIKRRQQKEERVAFANVFQTRALRERKPVSYVYCKELLCSITLAKHEKNETLPRLFLTLAIILGFMNCSLVVYIENSCSFGIAHCVVNFMHLSIVSFY